MSIFNRIYNYLLNNPNLYCRGFKATIDDTNNEYECADGSIICDLKFPIKNANLIMITERIDGIEILYTTQFVYIPSTKRYLPFNEIKEIYAEYWKDCKRKFFGIGDINYDYDKICHFIDNIISENILNLKKILINIKKENIEGDFVW